MQRQKINKCESAGKKTRIIDKLGRKKGSGAPHTIYCRNWNIACEKITNIKF